MKQTKNPNRPPKMKAKEKQALHKARRISPEWFGECTPGTDESAVVQYIANAPIQDGDRSRIAREREARLAVVNTYKKIFIEYAKEEQICCAKQVPIYTPRQTAFFADFYIPKYNLIVEIEPVIDVGRSCRVRKGEYKALKELGYYVILLEIRQLLSGEYKDIMKAVFTVIEQDRSMMR